MIQSYIRKNWGIPQRDEQKQVTKEPAKEKQKQSLIKSTISMAVGTFSSRILGFLRDALMYALFSRSVTDAWVVAFRLPNIFRRVLGEGSLSPSFIPIYVDTRARSPEDARRLANAVFSIVFAVATVISVVCFVYMEQIMWYLIGDPHGFAAVPGKVEQTIYLARIMIFYLILVSTFAFHMAVANTHGHFFIPAIGPTLFNFGLILFTVTHWELGTYPGSTQSWGVIFGGFLQVGVVAWLLIKEGYLPRFTWSWGAPGVARVFGNMVPGLFGLGVFQVMTLVNTKFAARLSEGAQSYIYAADRILELPQSLIAVSLGAALLPRFSELSGIGTRGKFLTEANQAVRTLLYLSLPAAVGMYTLADGLTQVLFMRGAFTAADAAQTANVVEIYSVLMLFSSLSRVTAPAFYALKNTWLPACVAFFVLLVHISVGPYLVDRFGLTGLATATSVSSILNIVILQIFFFYVIGSLGYGKILKSVARLLPALLTLGLLCHYTYTPLVEMASQWLSPGKARTLALGVTITVGMAIYFYISLLFGSEESHQVTGILKRRLGRKV
jgi:putative peptidoglycan lipid II flippase